MNAIQAVARRAWNRERSRPVMPVEPFSRWRQTPRFTVEAVLCAEEAGGVGALEGNAYVRPLACQTSRRPLAMGAVLILHVPEPVEVGLVAGV